MQFFSPDSKFTQMMTSFGEMIIANFCWIIGSLPLVTIGASNVAMYTVLGRRLREDDHGTIIPFFKAWWSNLIQGSLFWVAQVLITCSLVSILFLPMPAFLKVIAVIFLLLVTVVFSIIYPQVARFKNRWFPFLRNAIILLITRLRWALLNLLLILTPLALFLIAPIDFLRFGFVWITCGFSGVFFISAELMQKVLQPLEDLSAKK